MNDKIVLLDVVALTCDLESEGLVRGQVGTVVEKLAEDVFEIDFSDDSGETYAMLPLKKEQILVLRHAPMAAL